MYRQIIKPLGDFIVSLSLLIILSPIIVITAILLSVVNNGKVFFFQQRPGLNGKPFNIIKFKTMRDTLDKDGILLPDIFRLTRVGVVIRSLSLDELLQLVNVLKGEMSLVGPRPLLIKYLSIYNSDQSRRHNVKPGITGWAQVNGRNAISWVEKFKYDVEYVEKQSFLFDIRILWKTLTYVIQRKGINADGHVSMEEFKG
jgi:undecaprenyl phosphate N,N'-diacetylbacillosamine 1-phosphate transferase